jgi:hypothetical protein
MCLSRTCCNLAVISVGKVLILLTIPNRETTPIYIYLRLVRLDPVWAGMPRKAVSRNSMECPLCQGEVWRHLQNHVESYPGFLQFNRTLCYIWLILNIHIAYKQATVSLGCIVIDRFIRG